MTVRMGVSSIVVSAFDCTTVSGSRITSRTEGERAFMATNAVAVHASTSGVAGALWALLAFCASAALSMPLVNSTQDSRDRAAGYMIDLRGGCRRASMHDGSRRSWSI